MTQKVKQPWVLLIVDGLGMALLAVGIAELFAEVNWVPLMFRFANFELIMIFFGVLLTLPYLVWVIKNAPDKQPN